MIKSNITLLMLIFISFWSLAQNTGNVLAQSGAKGTTLMTTGNVDTTLANQYLKRANYLYNVNEFDSLAILANEASSIFAEAKIWEDYVEAQLLLAIDLYLKDDLNGSQAMTDEILATSLKELGTTHPVTAKAYMNKGILLLANLEADEALENFSLAHRILTNAPGQTITIAKLYNLIAFTQSYFKNNNEKAMTYCTTALAILKNKLDANDAEIGNTYADLGLLYFELNKPKEALDNFDQALKIYYRNYSKNLPAVAMANYKIGQIKAGEELYREAVEYYEKAIEILLLTLGEENHLAVSIYSRLGQTYMGKLGDKNKAIPYLKKAIVLDKKLNATKDADRTYRYRILGKYYLGQ